MDRQDPAAGYTFLLIVSNPDRIQAPPPWGRARKLMFGLCTRSGIVGQGARFAVAGSVVMLVYLIATTVLGVVVGLPFQLALAIGFCLALAVHFTLQRLFVWADREEFALSLRHQVGRYLLASGAQYGITAAGTSLLPPLLGLSTEVVYLASVPLVTSANFLVFRQVVFHDRSTVVDSRDLRR